MSDDEPCRMSLDEMWERWMTLPLVAALHEFRQLWCETNAGMPITPFRKPTMTVLEEMWLGVLRWRERDPAGRMVNASLMDRNIYVAATLFVPVFTRRAITFPGKRPITADEVCRRLDNLFSDILEGK